MSSQGGKSTGAGTSDCCPEWGRQGSKGEPESCAPGEPVDPRVVGDP